MSTIFERKGNLYIRYYDSQAGRGREMAIGAKDNRLGWIEARKFKKRFDSQLESGLLRSRFKKKTECIYLSEAIEEFIEKKSNGPDKLAPKTIRGYERITQYLLDVCDDKPLSDYKAKDILKLYNYLEKKEKVAHNKKPAEKKDTVADDGTKKEVKTLQHNTISGYFRYLHHFFAHFQKHIEENPVDKIKPQEKLPEAIPEDDLKLILDKLKANTDYPEQYNIIYFLLWSGFRSNEACQLDWSQINMDTRLITFENFKGKVKYDYYPIHEELFNHLKSLGPKKQGKVFPYSGPDRLKFFDRTQKGLDLRKHYIIHQLRKTFASRCVNSGVDPYDLQKLLRHRDISTTLKYYTEADLQRIGREVDRKVKIKE